jgi:hypothetical protein
MLRPAAGGSEGADCKAAEKQERIVRLKQTGWRVDKERFGWKGEECYRELRRRVDVELKGLGVRHKATERFTKSNLDNLGSVSTRC